MAQSPETFYGEAESHQSMSADVVLHAGSKRVVMLNATTTGLNVDLPDAQTLHLGGPHFYLLNVGSNTITVRDDGANTVHSLAGSKAVILGLVQQDDADGMWAKHELDVN